MASTASHLPLQIHSPNSGQSQKQSEAGECIEVLSRDPASKESETVGLDAPRSQEGMLEQSEAIHNGATFKSEDFMKEDDVLTKDTNDQTQDKIIEQDDSFGSGPLSPINTDQGKDIEPMKSDSESQTSFEHDDNRTTNEIPNSLTWSDEQADTMMANRQDMNKGNLNDKPGFHGDLEKLAIKLENGLGELLESSREVDLPDIKHTLAMVVNEMKENITEIVKRTRDSTEAFRNLKIENDELRQTIERLNKTDTNKSITRGHNSGSKNGEDIDQDAVYQSAYAAFDHAFHAQLGSRGHSNIGRVTRQAQQIDAQVGLGSRPTLPGNVNWLRRDREWEEPGTSAPRTSRSPTMEPDTLYSATFKTKVRSNVQTRFVKVDPRQRKRGLSLTPLETGLTDTFQSINEGERSNIQPVTSVLKEPGTQPLASADSSPNTKDNVDAAKTGTTPVTSYPNERSLLDEGIDEFSPVTEGFMKSPSELKSQLSDGPAVSSHEHIKNEPKHMPNHQKQGRKTSRLRVRRKPPHWRRRLSTGSKCSKKPRDLRTLLPIASSDPQTEKCHDHISSNSKSQAQDTEHTNRVVRVLNKQVNRRAGLLIGGLLYFIFVVATLQVWKSCRDQQRIWFEANGLTRHYMLSRYRAEQTWLGSWGIDLDLFYSFGEILRKFLYLVIWHSLLWCLQRL